MFKNNNFRLFCLFKKYTFSFPQITVNVVSVDPSLNFDYEAFYNGYSSDSGDGSDGGQNGKAGKNYGRRGLGSSVGPVVWGVILFFALGLTCILCLKLGTAAKKKFYWRLKKDGGGNSKNGGGGGGGGDGVSDDSGNVEGEGEEEEQVDGGGKSQVCGNLIIYLLLFLLLVVEVVHAAAAVVVVVSASASDRSRGTSGLATVRNLQYILIITLVLSRWRPTVVASAPSPLRAKRTPSPAW